jgi:hypothetical protein
MTGFKKGYRVVFEAGLCWPGIPHVRHNPRQRWSLMRAQLRPLLVVFAAVLAQVLELGRHVLLQNTGQEGCRCYHARPSGTGIFCPQDAFSPFKESCVATGRPSACPGPLRIAIMGRGMSWA